MTDIAIPDLDSWVGRQRAILQLRAYFRPTDPSRAFTGAHFERLGGGGDRPATAHEFTAEDLVAVTMLSVDIPPAAALQILGPLRTRLSELLRTIPTDVDLVNVDPAEIDASWQPWVLFEVLGGLKGVGRTTATKLLARKCPRLIPIYDREVNRVLGLNKGAHWRPLACALRADDRALHRALVELRAESGIGEDISPLRVLDVVTWMTGKGLTGAGR